MDAYSRNAYNTIQNDLKIFCGKRDEIAKMQRENKIVPNKIYLAWDYGEIYIANQSAKLFQYGASNDLIQKTIEKEIEGFLTKLENITELNHKLQNKYDTIEPAIDAKIATDVPDAINRAISSDTVKDLINDRITTLFDSLNNSENNAYIRNILTEIIIDRDLVTAQTVSGEIDDSINNRTMQIVSGYSLKNIITAAKVGVYFCTTDYEDDENYNFTKGAIYEVYKIFNTSGSPASYRRITLPESAEDYKAPNIVAPVKVTQEFGSYLNGISIDYFIENFNNVLDNSKLNLVYVDGNGLETNLFNDNNEPADDDKPLARQEGSITIYKDLPIKFGESYIKLSGTDKLNNSFYTLIPVYGYAPVYYGSGQEQNTEISYLNKATNNQTVLNYNTQNGDYIFIYSNKEINILLDGIDITNNFDRTQTTTISNNNIYAPYYIYRSIGKTNQSIFALSIKEV